MKSLPWKGIYSAVTTQFTQSGTIETSAFHQNLLFQANAGVDAFIVGGSLGESSSITHDERILLLTIAQKVLPANLPVLVNIAEGSTQTAIHLAGRAEDAGAHGLMLLPPMMYRATANEVIRFFQDIAASTSLPILVYNNPLDYRTEITMDMFDQLLKIENIQAVKESTRDVSNVTRLRNAYGSRLKILTGVDTIATESLLLGADGWVAGLVNAFPAETVALYRLLTEGRMQEAIELHRWFLPLLELDISPQLVQNIKLAQKIMDVGNEYVRPPRQLLDGVERNKVVDVIQASLRRRPGMLNVTVSPAIESW